MTAVKSLAGWVLLPNVNVATGTLVSWLNSKPLTGTPGTANCGCAMVVVAGELLFAGFASEVVLLTAAVSVWLPVLLNVRTTVRETLAPAAAGASVEVFAA